MNTKTYDFDFKDIIENARDIIIVTKTGPIDEPGPEIIYVNKAFTDLTGYTSAEILGKNPRILQTEDTDKECTNAIRNALLEQKPVRTTLKNAGKHGKEYWLDISILPLKDTTGNVTHFVAIERDVTDQKILQHKLEHLSRTDALTGVYNRRAFDEILANEFTRFNRTNEKFSILTLDVDSFKAINDSHGHDAGDEVLKTIATICESNLRTHDTVSRIGGDEFCILLPCTNSDTAASIAEKLRKHITTDPVPIKSGTISITVSIGVTEADNSDRNHSDVLKRADVKLYEAKNIGRNRVES